VLLRTAPDEVADKTWRAYGLLKYARKLTFEETMNLLSGVRLGVGLNLIPGLSVYTLNKLMIFTQPAHLAALDGRHTGDPDSPTAKKSSRKSRRRSRRGKRRRPPAPICRTRPAPRRCSSSP